MELRTEPVPGVAERTARTAVVVFLALASLLLTFALGYGLKEITTDDKTTVTTAAPRGTAASGAQSTASGDTIGAAIIDEIVNVLKDQYVDRKTLDPTVLKEAAIGGIITALNDRETHYLSPEELKGGSLSLQSTYQGIGASVSSRSGEIKIVAPFRDSPAAAAGIRAGDTILEVDGQLTDGWTDTFAVEKIRGPKGTAVNLKVRHADGVIATLSVTRGDIDIQSVYSEPNLEIIPGESKKTIVDRTGAAAKDIAYLSISQFHDKTHDELVKLGKDIEKQGYKGLILDLRGNPGGGLTATEDVADEFLSSGTIIMEEDSDGKRTSTPAKAGGILTKIPIVILQDTGSASGAEVLAGALRDNGRATIVGTRSYGKGTVNRLIPLKNCGQANCGAVYLAVGRWLTPKGEQIEGLGIKPDVEVLMTSQQYIDEGDIQLFKAIDILRGTK